MADEYPTYGALSPGLNIVCWSYLHEFDILTFAGGLQSTTGILTYLVGTARIENEGGNDSLGIFLEEILLFNSSTLFS